MERKPEAPCTSCRIISVGCLFFIGGYFIKLGTTNRPRYLYRMIAAGTFGLGIGEIFNYSPFRDNKNT